MNKRIYLLLLMLALGLEPLGAMHIMEGFIPLKWCIIWYLIALPFVVFSSSLCSSSDQGFSSYEEFFRLGSCLYFHSLSSKDALRRGE